MKFGMEDLHLMMPSICDFRENQLTEGRTFPVAVKKIAFTRVAWNRVTFWK
jgi:hypothetical protein